MTARQSIARRRMLDGPGHLYAAYSRYCDWVKVGFSSKLGDRLETINSQYAKFAPFSLIGTVRSTWAAEQQLHRLLSPFRQNRIGRTRELYPATPSVVAAIKAVVSNPHWERLPFDGWREVSTWARQAARAPANHDEAIRSYELLRRF